MASSKRTALAAALVLVLAAGAAPADARAGRAPGVDAKLVSVTCNPGGEAGLRVSATASASGGSIAGASLYVGEFQAVADPAYAPFPWTGATLANWMRRDGWRSGTATDTRVLDTRDPHTWNLRNHAVGVWSRSMADSWWIVLYSVSLSSRAGEVTVGRYVSCPSGAFVDQATLTPITYVDEPGLR